MYPDPNALTPVLDELAQRPPLVRIDDIQQLHTQLQAAYEGERFVLQGGDCAELFSECTDAHIQQKLDILGAMQHILQQGLQKPILCIGRIAGQFGKPRSLITETRGQITLPSYRGDMINSAEFTANARTPDPNRLIQAYDMAQKTYALIAPLFASHEALHLPFERALTRQGYNLSTHFPWVGMRSCQPNSPHIAYSKTIANPIAIKVGPLLKPDQLLELIDELNPDNIPGRLSLIHRLGYEDITHQLPPLIELVKKHHKKVLWICDPMHGNTKRTHDNIKTRYFDHIIEELAQAVEIHKRYDQSLNGVHIELTGDHVTECIGGALTEEDLARAYKSMVDPRLNATQSLELAKIIVELMQHQNENVVS